MPTDFDRGIERLALLDDPVRRALYAHVARQAGYVGREQTAAAVGISRGLAAFHLDKLAAEGLLEVVYRRPEGRRGPGAGRPAKLYRRSPGQVSVSLPPRDYELLAGLLAGALDRPLPEDVAGELAEAAGRAGGALGSEARRRAGGRPALEAGLEALARQGFEPEREGDSVALRNCPFQAVAAEHPDLVCPLNLALVEGFVAALDAGLRVRLEPRAGACCVVIQLAEPAPYARPA